MAANNEPKKFVFLVHGLFGSPQILVFSLSSSKKWATAAFGFVTKVRNLLSMKLVNSSPQFILDKRAEWSTAEFNVVAHSMGGAVARAAMNFLTENEKIVFANVNNLVMLASPHRGSPVASSRIVTKLDRLIAKARPIPALSQFNRSPSSAINSLGPATGFANVGHVRSVRDFHFGTEDEALEGSDELMLERLKIIGPAYVRVPMRALARVFDHLPLIFSAEAAEAAISYISFGQFSNPSEP